jgi:hypothetical protein
MAGVWAMPSKTMGISEKDPLGKRLGKQNRSENGL